MSKRVGKKKAEASNANNPAKTNGSGGAATTDPRVAQQMRVQQVVGAGSKGGQKDDQTYSPRTMAYIERLGDILGEWHGYSQKDIANLVKRCHYDEAEIETTVANIVEMDQKSSSSEWNVVKGKKQFKEEKQLVEKEKKKEQEIKEGVMQAMAEFESQHTGRAQILAIDQDLKQTGALVLVTGCLSWESTEGNAQAPETKNRHFARAFYVDQKAEQSEGYSVLNDVHRFMSADGDDAAWPPGSTTADDAASSCPPGFVSEEAANAQAERHQMEIAELRKELDMMRTEAERVAAEKDQLRLELRSAHETIDAHKKSIDVCTSRLEQAGSETENLRVELASAYKTVEALRAEAALAERRAEAAEAAAQAAQQAAAQAAAAQAYEVQPPPQSQEQQPMQPAYQVQPDVEVAGSYEADAVQEPQAPLTDEVNDTAAANCEAEEMPNDVVEEEEAVPPGFDQSGSEEGEADGDEGGDAEGATPEAAGAEESAPAPSSEEPAKKSWASIAGGLREDKGKLGASKVQGFAVSAMGPPPGARLPPPSASAGAAAQNSSGRGRGGGGRGGGGRGGGGGEKVQDTGADAASSPADKGGDAANNDKRRRPRQRPQQRDRPAQQEGERQPQPDGVQPERPDRRRPPRSGKGGKGGKGGSAAGSGGRGSGG